MLYNYQVNARFAFVKGKAQLVSTAIYSTRAACTSIPFSPVGYSFLTNSHIFPTLQLAWSYIAHLHRVYPNSTAAAPVLDSGQNELFREVTK